MLHAEPFETHLLSAELCILFIYFLKGNCIGLEYHIILSKIHIIVIIKTKIIDQNKSCSNTVRVVILSSQKLKVQYLLDPLIPLPGGALSENQCLFDTLADTCLVF